MTIDRVAGAALGQAGVDDEARSVVAAVLSGRRNAFRVLVERESASVVRACVRVLGDQHEAEDVAQEAFLVAYRSLAGWRGDGSFGAWLGRIAVRLAIRRAAARRTSVRWIAPITTDVAVRADPDDGGAPFAGRSTAPVGGSTGTDPAGAFLVAERGALLRQAVGRLDDPYREVVALRFFGDLSLTEIAAERGTPVPTVKTHLRRGLARLREIIDRESLR